MIGSEVIAALLEFDDEMAREADAGASSEVAVEHMRRVARSLGLSDEGVSAIRSYAIGIADGLGRGVALQLPDVMESRGMDPEDGALFTLMFIATVYSLGFEDGVGALLVLQRRQAEVAGRRSCRGGHHDWIGMPGAGVVACTRCEATEEDGNG